MDIRLKGAGTSGARGRAVRAKNTSSSSSSSSFIATIIIIIIITVVVAVVVVALDVVENDEGARRGKLETEGASVL